MSSRESPVDDGPSGGEVDRRSFIKSALLVGGSAGLTSLTSLLGATGTASAGETASIPERQNRQHAWNDYSTSLHGTKVPPQYTLFLCLDLQSGAVEGGTPTAEARAQVDAALESIENTYAWDSKGVLFTMGYSRSYFDRFDEALPGKLSDRDSALGLIDPEITNQVTAAPHEDPDDIAADDYDAVLHLASDDPRKLLAVELALWSAQDGSYDLDKQGDDDLSPDVPQFDATFEGVFERPTAPPGRRVSYVGHETLVEEFEEAFGDSDRFGDVPDAIPEESELSMGVNVLFKNSNPPEALATMTEDGALAGTPQEPGVFAQGAMQHVSKLDIALDKWYGNNDIDERRKQLLSPDHTEANTGVAGEDLGNSTATDTAMRNADGEGLAEQVVEDAENLSMVGHAQKIARARAPMESRQTGDAGAERQDDLRGHDGVQELEPPILRRDAPTADTGRPGLNFVSLMRFNGYLHYIRQAMNGTAFDTAAFGVDGDARLDHPSVIDEVGDADGDGDTTTGDTDGDGDNNNGIVPYLTTKRRANYVVPPITVRALPPARAARPDITVDGDNRVNLDSNGNVDVDVYYADAGIDIHDVDHENVRFGQSFRVNGGAGVKPDKAMLKGDYVRYKFDADKMTFTDDDVTADGYDDDGDNDGIVTARLFAQTDDAYPIRGTQECEVK